MPEVTETAWIYNPGSPEAVTLGCKCPILDNARGKGRGGDGKRFGWWISGNCPMHGRLMKREGEALADLGEEDSR